MNAAVANLATEVMNHELVARAGGGSANPERPPAYKAVGISLAIASGLFIGTSFVLKKVGLLKANVKYSEEAGEGYGYLKNFYWWSGMTLMIIGEICNFVAYALSVYIPSHCSRITRVCMGATSETTVLTMSRITASMLSW